MAHWDIVLLFQPAVHSRSMSYHALCLWPYGYVPIPYAHNALFGAKSSTMEREFSGAVEAMLD